VHLTGKPEDPHFTIMEVAVDRQSTTPGLHFELFVTISTENEFYVLLVVILSCSSVTVLQTRWQH